MNVSPTESSAQLQKVVVTGAAGLVGQNLMLLLREAGVENVVAIDKQEENLKLLSLVNANVRTVVADLAEPGAWEDEFADASAAVILHAQITGKTREPFVRNNLDASARVHRALLRFEVPFTVHVSSSVVHSVVEDFYTETKKEQEKAFLESGLPGCVLRPTLMYGWFDPKHLGWLARFMGRTPVFPVPGDGRFMRQPLYNRDFCRAIIWCLANRPFGEVYDLVGEERIDYIDMVREIRDVKQLKTPIVHLPMSLFGFLLRVYAGFTNKPPFTVEQLKALSAGDEFVGVDIRKTFGFSPTPFRDGIRETFCDPIYSKYTVSVVD